MERLTLDMEKGAFDYFDKLDAMGGMVKAIERGYPQKEIAESAYQYQRAVEAREKIVVGVNDFTIEEEFSGRAGGRPFGSHTTAPGCTHLLRPPCRPCRGAPP